MSAVMCYESLCDFCCDRVTGPGDVVMMADSIHNQTVHVRREVS